MSGQDLRENPYVGLRPFFVEDCLYFFGRERQTAELIDILRQHRFVGVVGSSGSGKSSLVRAGLLPALLGGFLVQDRDRWRMVQMKPGDAPIANLASGLLEAMEQTPSPEVVAQLEKDIREAHTDAVVEFLKPLLESNANLFLLVDQFEEIFTFRGIDEEDEEQSHDLTRRKERAWRRAEAADFVDLLLDLAEQRNLPIYVALTMRTDFLGDCDLFYGLPEALNRGRYLVPRMTREQLREAVECPTLLLRAQIAPRLMDHLLNELGDQFDRLPVLQHALLRTWDEWQRAGGVGPIDLRHYESAGGLERALDQDAEGALKGLDIAITARVFKRLTDTDQRRRRVRSPARISELKDAASVDRGTVEEIVRRFEEDGRSFVHSSDDGKLDDPRVDISHESLIRQWDRMRDWVDEERRSRDEYHELVNKARKWERGEAALLQDPELQIVVDWREKAPPSRGWAQRYSLAEGDFDSAVDYLDESLATRCRNLAETELRRRWKIWNWLILFVVVVAAAAALVLEAQFLVLEAQFRGGPNTSAVSTAAVDVPPGPTPPGLQPGSAEGAEDSTTQKTSPEINRVKQEFFSKTQGWRDFGKKNVYLGLFVLAYLGLTVVGTRVHRRLRYAVILQGIVSSRGRSAIKEKVAAKLQDAVVAHETTYAPTFRRIFGFVIDFILLIVMWTAVTLVFWSIVLNFESALDTASDGLVDAWFALILGSSWLYATLQIASRQQATLGMRAVGIFRTDLHGERLSFARASAWFASRLLSYVLYGLGFVIQPFTPKRQTLHDLMAGTVVLRRPPTSSAPVA